MKSDPTLQGLAVAERIATLVRALNEAESELQGVSGEKMQTGFDSKGKTPLLRETKETLFTSEALQRYLSETQTAILNALPASIALLNQEGMIVTANEGWCRCGVESAVLSPAFGIGTNYIQACEATTGEGANEAITIAAGIRRVLEGCESRFDYEYNFKTSKEFLWFRIIVTPLNQSNRKDVLVVHINITEQRLAGESLRLNAKMLDSIGQAVVATDMNGRITYWNKGAERMWGWQAEEVKQLSKIPLLYKDTASIRDAQLAESSAKDEWQYETATYTKEGKTRIVDVYGTLVRNSFGDPVSIVTVTTDITEKKQSEEQYYRAQRLESIGILASGIAHDLNNLLAPILMSVGILKGMVWEKDPNVVLTVLENRTQRAANLVKQMLSFTRGVQEKRVQVNLLQVVNNIEILIRDSFPKNINLCIASEPSLWDVLGNSTQLHQVIMNLCLNARDAMPSGGMLAITMKNTLLEEPHTCMNPDAKAGKYVMLNVADTGSGIRSEILHKIFDPFFTTKPIGKGMGLGLSTTQAIVKSHGGFICVDTEGGKGSQFKVYLPAGRMPNQDDNPAVQSALVRSGNGEMILVVDDEEAIRSMAKQILEGSGYRVLLAANGAEGAALYTRNAKDIALVLADLDMPLMDGSSMIAALQAINPNVCVISSTGGSTLSSAKKTTIKEVKYCLLKPYNVNTLLKRVGEALYEKML